MSDQELAKLLWDSANLITGFLAAQTFAFVFATAQKDFGNAIDGPGTKLMISLLSTVVAIVYGIAVYWCATKAIALSPVDMSAARVFKTANWARLVAISLFWLISMLALWARQLQGKGFNC